jgi:EAL domain-containing protein (putative c-di-GMP-specific phosphodiesterase class I)
MSSAKTSVRPAVRDRFLAFAFAAADLLVETGPDGKITWAAGAFAARFGIAPETFFGRPIESLVARVDRPAVAHAVAQTQMHGRMPPLIVRLNDGHETRCALGALAVPDETGRLCFTFGTLPAESLPSPTPELAGATLGRQAEASLRAGQPRSLGMLDVAGWSAANATLPTSRRRSLRENVIQVLTELAGPGAMVGEAGQGRYNVRGWSDLDLPRLIEGVESVLQASPGIANGGAAHGSVQVKGQELALSLAGLTEGQASRALRFGLSRFAAGGLAALSAAGFEDGLSGFIAEAGTQATALRARIAGRHFRMAYQPVVSLPDRVPHHYEALFRPISLPGALGLGTQDFITLAEAVGLSEELDLAVLNEALETVRETGGVRVAVNISGLSMQNPAFRAQLLDMITPGCGLIAELTETADITDTASVAATLIAIRQAGVPVCIDDFGAGSAAFRYLRDFRVDYVKIDGSYVHAATAGRREQGFVESMCDLAVSVGAAVIAEMVENEAQAKLMTSLEIPFAQGYLFGRPGHLPGSRRRE